MIKNGQMQIIVNTPSGMNPRLDENRIREEALLGRVCMITTIMGAYAAIQGIRALKEQPLTVKSLQEYGRIMREKRAGLGDI